jgi:hypothetical protein
MKKRLTLVAALAATIVMTGCMSNKEFVLRQNDIKAKSEWPATYNPIVIRGPLTLDKDSELVVTVPNQPYQHTPIPNGQEIQANLVKDIVHTGAIVGGAAYSIRKANGSSTTNITNNNNAAGGGE